MSRHAKILLSVGLLLAAGLLVAGDVGGRYLSLDALRASQAHYQALYAQRPVTVLTGYALLHASLSAAALPGSFALMSLAGGALFGLPMGAVAAVCAGVTGAAISFLLSRTLLRGWVERRFGGLLGRVNEGLDRGGPLYLIALRLMPVMPFFATNMLMGLTRLRLTAFVWASLLGLLPVTLVYANAGLELTRLRSLADAASPRLLLSLALLGLLPLLGQAAARLLRRRAAARVS